MAINILANTLYVANSQAAANNIWQIDIPSGVITPIANVTAFHVQIDINPSGLCQHWSVECRSFH
ncbi:hypothetical protein MKY96_06095 [Paenibacillus sp. FSL R7-0302]|uniref:hypothetical protein n=1 Tax=Paenibacillus sp. FSL R7-0302 TaxID=2921681 RepID=UPI0030F878D7